MLHNIRQPHPFGWGADFGGDDPFMRRFFGEASGFGICHGYTIPIRHWHGRFAALPFATDQQYAAFLHITQRHTLAQGAIAYQLHLEVREKSEPPNTIADIHLI